jgi:hypothetical protein
MSPTPSTEQIEAALQVCMIPWPTMVVSMWEIITWLRRNLLVFCRMKHHGMRKHHVLGAIRELLRNPESRNWPCSFFDRSSFAEEILPPCSGKTGKFNGKEDPVWSGEGDAGSSPAVQAIWRCEGRLLLSGRITQTIRYARRNVIFIPCPSAGLIASSHLLSASSYSPSGNDWSWVQWASAAISRPAWMQDSEDTLLGIHILVSCVQKALRIQ